MPETPAQQGFEVTGGIDPSLLRKATEDYADFVTAVKEAVWNEADAGGSALFVQFVTRGRERDLYVWGNGVGISDDGLHAIVRIMDSPSAKDPKKRGRIGTGSKAFCRHARALTVQTLRSGEHQILQIEYTREELNEILHSRQTVLWRRLEIPATCKIKGSGACFIWHGLGLGDAQYVNPKHQRTAQRLIAELAKHLPRDVARMVTIIDEVGKPHKLVQRNLIGALVEGSHTIPGIGSVSFEIAVTSAIDPLDRLSLWGQDRACTINSFLNHVRKTGAITPFLSAVSRVLDHPQVIGQIAIPGWNDYVLRATDAGFRQDLYDDEDTVFAFLSWLFETVVPRVEKLLGTQPTENTSDADTLCAKLTAQFQTIEGKPQDTEDTVDLSALMTEPARVTLECGESVWVEIPAPEQGGEYHWDDSGAPSTVSPRRGTRARFTGGSAPGSGHVALKLGDKTRKIHVEVAQRLQPSLVYRSRRVDVGQRITHRVIHTRHLKGVPRWSIDNTHGALVEHSSDGLSVVHQVPSSPGTYTVLVEIDLDDTSTESLCATVIATEPSEERPTRRKTSDAEFSFNGHRFVLALRNFPGEAARIASYMDTVNQGRTRVTLNFGHPEYAGADPVRVRVAQLKIALHIAADEERRTPSVGASSDVIVSRASEIFALLAKKIAKN